MTDQAKLERAYRRLLAWYPRAFRRENGPEFLGVLMDCAPDGQRRPSLAESADLIRSGVWMRLRPSVPRSAGTVRAAVRLHQGSATPGRPPMPHSERPISQYSHAESVVSGDPAFSR